MAANHTIRAFSRADQALVEALVLGIQQAEFSLALTAENQPDLKDVAAFFAGPGSGFWVTLIDNEIVGCIGLEAIAGDVAVMRKFMVARAHRGSASGVASGLLATFEAHARAQGHSTIALSTVLETKAAQRFYTKMGYVAATAADMPPGFTPGVLDQVFFIKTLA